MDPFRNRRGRGGQFGELLQASGFRRTDHPGRGFFGGFATFIDAAALPSSGRRGISSTSRQFIHTFIDRPYSALENYLGNISPARGL